MPKVSGKAVKSVIKDSKFYCVIQLNGKMPKVGDKVVCKWGKPRTLSQNAFLWVFYDWLLDECNLKDEYSCAEELHDTMKSAFLSKRHITPNGQAIKKVGSSTELGKIEFGEFMDKINQAVIEWYGIDTSEFWQTSAENHAA